MAQERFQQDIAFFVENGPAFTAPAGTTVCLLGSSIMRMWPKRMAEEALSAPVLNLAFGGSQTFDLVEHRTVLCDLVARSRPLGVLFYCGSNDISYGERAGAIFERAKSFLDVLRQNDAPIHVIGVLESPEKKCDDSRLREVRAYNGLLEEYCDKNSPTCAFVDPQPSLTSTVQQCREHFEYDGVHLSNKGYAQWSAIIRSCTQK